MVPYYVPARVWQAEKQQPKSTGDNKNKPGNAQPKKE